MVLWLRRLRAFWGRKAWRAVWSDHQIAIIGGLWLAAYTLGVVGTIKEFAARGDDQSWYDPLYRSLQLFMLDDSMIVLGPVASWELAVAKFLAPAVMGYTAFIALSSIFQEQIHLLWLRWYSGHVVICGLGRKGAQLAKDFLDHGLRVVAIEYDDGNDEIVGCRAHGGIVLLGDAADEEVLEKARVHRAQCLISVCGDDGTNVEIAVHTNRLVRLKPKWPVVRDLAQAGSKTAQPWEEWASDPYDQDDRVRCFAHIIDLDLRNLLKDRFASRQGDPIELRFFNIFESGARAILEHNPPDVFADPDPTVPVHILVVGFGYFGESVVLAAAKIGHYAHGQPLRITVVDREATRKGDIFRARHPNIEQVCAINFLELDYEGADFVRNDYLWGKEQKGRFTIVYVCLDDDSRGLACALDIMPRLQRNQTPIVVRMGDNAGLATLLEKVEGDPPTTGDNLRAFLMINDTCQRHLILNDEQDKLAQVIHRQFLRRQLQGQAGGNVRPSPFAVPWAMLPEEIKDANRHQADHIPIKLRSIGCATRPAQDAQARPFEFTPAQVELMARMEHDRWKADRWLAGWTYVSGKKDPEKKTHPDLVAYDQLSEDIKEWDRHAVRDIPGLLAQIDREIYAVEAGQAGA